MASSGRLILWLQVIGLYRDDGKQNGNYHLGFRVEGLVARVQDLGFRISDSHDDVDP